MLRGLANPAEQVRDSHVNSLLFPSAAGSLEFERRAITTMDRGGAQVAIAALSIPGLRGIQTPVYQGRRGANFRSSVTARRLP